MGTGRRLAALVALSIAPTVVGSEARADDGPASWLAAQVRFEPLPAEGSRTEVAGLGAYRGTVEFRSGGGLSVFNELPLEDYVKGIVEMPAAWPSAALQAQAIAARTYVLHILAAQGEICPDDRCQYYMGLFGTERDGGDRWAAAVDATAGKVLLGNGRPIRAEFSASNGGRSLPGGSSWLRPVDDPDDSYSPTHHWRYTLPLTAFAPFASLPSGSSLVRLTRDGDSVVAVARPEQGEPFERHVPAGDFASAVNATLDAPGGLPLPFPSMTFSITTEGDQAVVDGGGWGHGRGMSQWGAYGKALRGLSAPDILAAYYGLRPSSLTADQAASPVRVSLGSGRRSTVVTLAQPTRVVAGDGTVLVPVTLGRWEVSSERGGVRVGTSAADGEGLRITTAELAAGRRMAGYRPTVRVSVSGPAVLTVRLRGPGVDAAPDPVMLLAGGEHAVDLPAAREPGEHLVTVEADGGPGRRDAVQLRFAIPPRTVYQASVPAGGSRPAAWPALAGLLVVAAAALTGATALRRTR